MKRFFRTDVEEISIARTGHVHRKAADPGVFGEPLRRDPAVDVDDANHLVVNCDVCDPELEAYGGVQNPNNVPLTFDEQRQADKIAKDGQVVTREFAQSFAHMAAEFTAARAAGRL